MNVLSKDKKGAIVTLLKNDVSQSEIKRKTGIARKTIRKYGRAHGLIRKASRSKSPGEDEVATGSSECLAQNPHPRPPARAPGHARSACEPHRIWIEDQVRMGRNAMSIYQDLVEIYAFTHKYNSVKRFVRQLRKKDPHQFDRLTFLPGEEAQVDYGQGAMTKTDRGTTRRPRLFVMTLKYSGRCFRKVVWRSSKKTWARLHEEAFRYFGGCPQYVVLDNLKEGVVKPDIYEPSLNPLYEEMLAHYGVVADPARVGDANRKGTVENAIKYTQDTGLKGRRFETIEDQNRWLKHWEETWAATRIHGRSKAQVEKRFQEERPFLKTLPAEPFRYFEEGVRTVWDDGCIQVKNAYYWAGPAPIGSTVIVRIYEDEGQLEIRDLAQNRLQRHSLSRQPGSVVMDEKHRVFNPSRKTLSLLKKAERIGPQTHALCQKWFEKEGRPSQRRMYGVVNLVRHQEASWIESASALALEHQIASFRVFKRLVLEQKKKAERSEPKPSDLSQEHRLIRHGGDYQKFWQEHARAGSNGPAEPAPASLTYGQLPLVWQNADWHRVVEAFGLTIDSRKSKLGRELWICSPFTDETDASLRMNLQRNIFMDFSRGQGGGILIFCQDVLALHGQHLSRWEVACWMVEKGISHLAPSPSSPTEEIGKRSNAPILTDLRPHLQPFSHGMQQRRISPQTCRYLGCGYLPPYHRKRTPLSGRLVFQVRGFTEQGVTPPILTHVGRALDADQEASNGKYWSYPFYKGCELYNQDHLLLDDQARHQAAIHGLVLVEGFFDVATFVEAGCRNVAALMGIVLTAHQIQRLEQIQQRVGFPSITLFLDRDAPGQKATQRIENQLAQAGFTVTTFPWEQVHDTHPGAKDPSDLGPEVLRRLRQQHMI